MRYRKRPIVIEAVPVASVTSAHHADGWAALPTWVGKAWESGVILVDYDSLIISTLEGKMRGDPGDMLIRGVKGELYACKPDVFAMTYEEAP